jgi:tetratricopeptide (TPR) repeat protein
MGAEVPVMRAAIPCLVLFVVLGVGCGAEPTADDHFRKGNEYLEKASAPEAIVEYRAALQQDPQRADIRMKLADAYVIRRDIKGALGEYVRAADQLPADATAQLRAGGLLLVAGQFNEAKSRAERALAIDARNVDAQILLGNALAGLKNLDEAIKEYQEAIALNPERTGAYTSIGSIQLARGQIAEAEATFRKAIAAAPKSAATHLALANFLSAVGRGADAEASFKSALTLEPNHIDANRALGMLYMLSNRAADAEPHFRTVATAARTFEATLGLADYYLLTARYDEARKTLAEPAAQEATFAVATTRLAVLDAAQGNRAAAMSKVETVLKKHPQDTSARLLQARLLRLDGKFAEALTQAEVVARDEPRPLIAGEAFLLVGRLQAALGRRDQAVAAYEEAMTRQPQSLEAALALGAIHASSGSTDKAATYAQQALAIQPANPQVRTLAIRIALARNELTQARAAIAALRKEFPDSVTALNLQAALQLAERQPEAARASYARALALAPNDLEAIQGLVRIDLDGGRSKEALTRVEAGLKTEAPGADFLVLAARAYGRAGDLRRAEDLLKRAIDVEPTRLAAYGLLGSLYVEEKRLDEATRQFQALVDRNPTDVGAGTMLGALFEIQKRLPDAEQQYRKIVTANPRAAVAANNLAWLLIDSDRNLDEGLQFAESAQQTLPDEPHITDTLGWAYYKKGRFDQAVRMLSRSVEAGATDPDTRYRLGLAYAGANDPRRAREQLNLALKLKPDSTLAAEAKRTLATLGK